MALFDQYTQLIGNTAMLRLNRCMGNKATVYAKLEGANPSSSVKARGAAAMIRTAEENGELKPGMRIIEPTSGNMGLALAAVAASKGYELTLTMPESVNLDRRRLLLTLGAKLVLTSEATGMIGALKKAQEIVRSRPEDYFMPHQFSNPAHVKVHEETTGPEIWNETNGEIDVLVAGVGTGATLTGVARYIKHTKGKNITVVAVEPKRSPVIAQQLAGEPLAPGPHKIQGLGAGFIPDNLDVSLIDRVENSGNMEAMSFARTLAKDEGILMGISSGAAGLAASRIAMQPEFAGKTIVVIFSDIAERYMRTQLFEGIENH
ncbi:MAG: Cysteine synthase [Desulfovibrio sp.]